MFTKKRPAMSTFLASILLVVFTLVVGGIVSSWMVDTAKQQTKNAVNNSDSGCIYASINVRDVYFNASGNDKLTFKIENTGTRTMTVNRIRIIYNNSESDVFEGSTYTYTVYPGDALPTSMPIDNSTIRTIDSVRVIPAECPTKAITIDGIEIN